MAFFSLALATCVSTMAPQQASVPAAGQSGSFDLTTTDGSCAWTATSNAPWLVPTPAGGNGNATVSYTAAVNEGPPRTAIVATDGASFTVEQASGCTLNLPETHGDVTEAGGTASFVVQTGAGCGFTATSNAAWLTAEVRDGTVVCHIAPNTDKPRSASVVVSQEGTTRTFVVEQGGQEMPVITEQPQSVSVQEGTQLSLTVDATGGGLRSQWRKNGVDIRGATGGIYTLAPVVASDSGNYDVVVHNAVGSVTSEVAVVTVIPSKDHGSTAGDAGKDSGGGCELGTGAPMGGAGMVSLGIALVALRRRRR